MSSDQQPTIAIITSLYCEKLAVDALIDDKITFVKCKTEGRLTTFVIVRHHNRVIIYMYTTLV